MMTSAQLRAMRDAVNLSPRDERLFNDYMADRKKRADAFRKGQLEQANNNYRAGMADLANVETLGWRIAEQVKNGDMTPQDGRAELDKLRRAYQAGQEIVQSAGSAVAAINETDPTEAWEAFVGRFPGLAERMPPPPACLYTAAPQS